MKTTKAIYKLIKENQNYQVIEMSHNLEEALSFKNNKTIEDGIEVSNIHIYGAFLIEKVINRKIENHFKSLLELIVSICESDEDPGSGLMFALNETERFKRELINKYNRYLTQKQKEFVDKKIKIIEKEVKQHLFEYQMLKQKEVMMQDVFQEQLEVEKESHRRR